MKKVKKDLTTIANQLTKLAAKIKNVATAMEGRPAKKTAKKRAARAAKKKAAPKGRKSITPTDQVLTIMKRYKKGLTVGDIRGKSGLSEKQISNIVHRACKKGKMKRVGRGVYSVQGV